MEISLTMTFFFVEADPLFHNNGNFDYNLKSSYSVISKFKLKCPMGDCDDDSECKPGLR